MWASLGTDVDKVLFSDSQPFGAVASAHHYTFSRCEPRMKYFRYSYGQRNGLQIRAVQQMSDLYDVPRAWQVVG